MKALFQLIKTLDKSEKRYFKIFSNKHVIKGSNHDVELFNAIVSLKEPSDKQLREKLQNPSILKNLSLYKHLLYKNLLRCLNAYYAARTIDDEIADLYKSAKILYDKALYEESKWMIEKAKKIALANEFLCQYLMLCEFENSIHEHHYDVKEYERVVIGGMKTEWKVMELLENQIKIRKIKSDIFNYSRTWGVFDKDLLQKNYPHDAIKEFEALKDSLESDKARFMSYRIQSLMAYHEKRFRDSRNAELKALQLIEKKPENFPGKSEEILTSLLRLIWNYFFEADSNKVEEIFKRVNNIPDSNNNIRLIKFTHFINYELLYKMNFGYHVTSEELEKRILDTYAYYTTNLSIQKKIIIDFNLCILFFLEGNYDKAGEWIQKVLRFHNKKIDTDVMISAKLAEIMLQYETGLYTLIPYSVLSARRYIKKKRDLTEFEMQLLSVMNKLSEEKHRVKEKQLLGAFAEEIKKMVREGKPVNSAFPYEIWCLARIEGKPLAEVFKREISKNRHGKKQR